MVNFEPKDGRPDLGDQPKSLDRASILDRKRNPLLKGVLVPFRKETRSGSGFGGGGWPSGRSSDTKRTRGRTSRPCKCASTARFHDVLHMRLSWMHRDLVPSVGVPERAAGDTSWTRSSSSEVHTFHIVHDVAVAKRIVGSPSFQMR